MINLTWVDLKAFMAARNSSLSAFLSAERYILIATDGKIQATSLLKTEGDIADYLANYASLANITSSDASGREIITGGLAPRGWTFQFLCFEVETSKLAAIICKDYKGVDVSGLTAKFFNSSDVELVAGTQAELDANCTTTQVDFFPTYDYMIIGGGIIQKTVPSTDMRIWVVVVPDIAAASGGSKELIINMNIDYFDSKYEWKLDGRVGKLLKYHASLKTNKMRMIVKHDTGVKHKVMINYEYYKL